MLEDKLSMYGISIEDASETEDKYYEYDMVFTNNRLYQEAVRELTREIFQRFCSSGEDVAKGAYHEMQGLKKIIAKLKGFEDEYHKVQAIKNDSE